MRRVLKRTWKGGALALAIVLIPTAALAVVGTFSSTTTTPAVTGTNSSAAAGSPGVFGTNTGGGLNTRYGVQGTANGTAGVGVWGTGTKYGVFSNGPLGVANGKFLTCVAATGCVGPGALLSNSVTNPKLAAGSVDSTKLAVGSVGASALQAGSVGSTALQTGSVGATALAADARPTVRSIAGFIGTVVLSGTYQYIGPSATVSVAAGQSVLATVSAAIGSTGGATASFNICGDTGGGLFPLGGGLFGVNVDASRRVYSNSVSQTLPPNTWNIGLCAFGLGTLDNNDFVSGSLMTTLSN